MDLGIHLTPKLNDSRGSTGRVYEMSQGEAYAFLYTIHRIRDPSSSIVRKIIMFGD